MASKGIQHGRSVQLDSAKLTQLMNARGMSVEQLARHAGRSEGTINNLLANRPAYRSTVADVADALEIGLDVLLKSDCSPKAIATVNEYLIADVLTDWQSASNGLKFQVCRLRHLELDRQARGKRFDLRDLATDEAQRCRTWIKRHPNVCETLSDHPNIIRNLTAFPDPQEDFYWVVDEWIDGEPLQRRLGSRVFKAAEAKQLLLDMARGLQALHEQGIVRRELSPSSVLINDSTARAVLTDFELAKLIDHGPTVSTDDWPIDPYRAPEADSDDVDVRADVYSWGRIGVHATLGELPDAIGGSAQTRLHECGERVAEILLSATSVLRGSRPHSMQTVIRVLEAWRV